MSHGISRRIELRLRVDGCLRVVNVADVLDNHPGGGALLTALTASEDATRPFLSAMHSAHATRWLLSLPYVDLPRFNPEALSISSHPWQDCIY